MRKLLIIKEKKIVLRAVKKVYNVTIQFLSNILDTEMIFESQFLVDLRC